MFDEIVAAANLITNELHLTYSSHKGRFNQALTKYLTQKCMNCWYEDNPTRGNATRSVFIDGMHSRVDPLIRRAMMDARLANEGMMDAQLVKYFIHSCVVWIDPGSVSVYNYTTNKQFDIFPEFKLDVSRQRKRRNHQDTSRHNSRPRPSSRPRSSRRVDKPKHARVVGAVY